MERIVFTVVVVLALALVGCAEEPEGAAWEWIVPSIVAAEAAGVPSGVLGGALVVALNIQEVVGPPSGIDWSQIDTSHSQGKLTVPLGALPQDVNLDRLTQDVTTFTTQFMSTLSEWHDRPWVIVHVDTLGQAVTPSGRLIDESGVPGDLITGELTEWTLDDYQRQIRSVENAQRAAAVARTSRDLEGATEALARASLLLRQMAEAYPRTEHWQREAALETLTTWQANPSLNVYANDLGQAVTPSGRLIDTSGVPGEPASGELREWTFSDYEKQVQAVDGLEDSITTASDPVEEETAVENLTCGWHLILQMAEAYEFTVLWMSSPGLAAESAPTNVDRTTGWSRWVAIAALLTVAVLGLLVAALR